MPRAARRRVAATPVAAPAALRRSLGAVVFRVKCNVLIDAPSVDKLSFLTNMCDDTCNLYLCDLSFYISVAAWSCSTLIFHAQIYFLLLVIIKFYMFTMRTVQCRAFACNLIFKLLYLHSYRECWVAFSRTTLATTVVSLDRDCAAYFTIIMFMT